VTFFEPQKKVERTRRPCFDYPFRNPFNMSSLRSGRVSRLPYRYREIAEVLVQKRKHVLHKKQAACPPVRSLGWMPRHARLSIEERKRLSSKMFLSNTLSDEYYTGSAAWETFARERSLKKVWEPFAGDGKIVGEWAKLGVDCVMSIGDFWSNLQVPEGVDYIATNPPFSFKWLVLETLLAFKKPMAVILPWQSFYRNGLARLNWLQQEFGGHWRQIPMTSAGQYFWHPPDKDYKKIGCFILEWTW